MNYKLSISYNGTSYHGWSIQPNAISIQEEIVNALSILFNLNNITINASGRTDAKVHAIDQVINIKHNDLKLDAESFMKALNSKLPYDINVNTCEIVDNNFHARYNCKSKTYMYLINTYDRFDVINHNTIYQYNKKIDVNKINEAAELFLGTHNFLSFSTSELNDTIRTINDIQINKIGHLIKIKISGDGFLRSMVRMIIGTLLWFNEDKINLSDIKKLLDNPIKGASQYKVPGCGLYLYKVYY